GWTPSPNHRGTADILWSCFLTLFTCSWTVLHLNIPSKLDGTPIKFFRKAYWMSITIIAPEFITMVAYEQWYRASKSVPQMRRLGLQDWDITHGFYADMGGFAVQFDDDSYYTLDFNQLHWFIEKGHLTIQDITISKENIQDRSKADVFTKSVACLQASWLVLQCIARTAQHLPTSQLELATCAYVPCALLTYWFWRGKPFDTDHQTMVGRDLKKELLSDLLAVCPGGNSHTLSQAHSADTRHRARRLPSLDPFYDTPFGSVILYAISLFFCALYMLAWDYDFPTTAEAYHWRIFATAGAGSSGLLLAIFVWRWRYGPGWKYMFIIMGCSVILYLAARFYLCFAMFYSLRSMPSRVYETVDWVVYLPHF
ncbi:hypothetical protein CONLIGDRAFT_544286, partial [Coniochaeta ligniaria NRRL 30616]